MSKWNAIRDRLGTVTVGAAGAMLINALVLTLMEAVYALYHGLSFKEYLFIKGDMSPFRVPINLSCLVGFIAGLVGLAFSKKRKLAAVATVGIGGFFMVNYVLFFRQPDPEGLHLNMLPENNRIIRVIADVEQPKGPSAEEEFTALKRRLAAETDAGVELSAEQPNR